MLPIGSQSRRDEHSVARMHWMPALGLSSVERSSRRLRGLLPVTTSGLSPIRRRQFSRHISELLDGARCAYPQPSHQNQGLMSPQRVASCLGAKRSPDLSPERLGFHQEPILRNSFSYCLYRPTLSATWSPRYHRGQEDPLSNDRPTKRCGCAHPSMTRYHASR